ncbi:MAG: hypothetical protein H6737_06960 [Alphaproteobacteria bacterium]|nr:hypothetical protein [Alphaproteobacteria bacterium]
MNDSVVALVRILGDIADAYGDASEAGGRAHRALALAEGIQEFRGQQIERLIMTCREMGPVLSPADRDKLKAAAMRVLADSRGFHAALGKGLRGSHGAG